MPDWPYREIIRTHEFEEQLDRLICVPEEADMFTAAAEDLLAREPEIGVPASDKFPIWALAMATVQNRRVVLYYTFDESAVTFIYILSFED